MPRAQATDTGALRDDHIISDPSSVQKILLKPSKDVLCDLVLGWLDNLPLCAQHPAAEDDSDDVDPPESVEDTKAAYLRMKYTNSVTKKAVVERIMERDWRNGLNLYQIAQVECRCVIDGTTAQKWTAGRLYLKNTSPDSELALPRFQSSSFIYNLQGIIKPMIKSHCHAFKNPELGLVIIRIQMHDSAGSAQTYNSLPPAKRIIFCAFPENAPMIFWNTGVNDPLRAILLQSLAPAMSRPGERFELKSTALTAKSLSTMVHMRSSARSTHALGAWSVYADNKVDKSPLCLITDETSENSESDVKEGEDSTRKRRKQIAEGRFGSSGIMGDGKAIEKFEILLQDKFPVLSEETMPQVEDEDGNIVAWRPSVTVRFEGPHVFAGIRETIENSNITDGLTMPGWMTGEDGVNVAAVRDGEVLKRKNKWY